jgi:DNA-binding NarL/FixJ family response regulator
MITESSKGITVVGAGLTTTSMKFVAQGLPECHILAAELDSWQVARFCKLVGPSILIVDQESLLRLDCEQVPAAEYLATVQVLMLSQNCSEDAYKAALLAGCSGLLPLDSPPENLLNVVKTIVAGNLWFPRAVLSALARKSILNRSILQKGLTGRETEILRLIGMDYKNQAIADQLFISRDTVRWHLRALYSKIGVTNRSEAYQYALKHYGDGHQADKPGEDASISTI